MWIREFVFEINDLFFVISDNFKETTTCNHETDKEKMLTFNFTRVFKSRGIDKPFSYLVKSGYSDNFATRVVNNRIEKMNLKDVEKLCELLQCTPNDLLQWNPSKEDENNEKHPLYSIKRSDKVVQLTKVLSSVPLDKLHEIENMIMKEINKK